MNIQYGFCKRLLLVLFAAVIAVCFYTISQVHRVPLMENGGRSFVKAQVISIVQDHEQAGDIYIGDQTVQLKLLTGEHAGETVQATSSSAYLYGVHCTVGMKVIAIVSESGGELVTSVYGYNRAPALYAIIGLLFTFVSIIWFFLPALYRGWSPILAAIVVVILTTLVTMYLVGGFTAKATVAVIGTVLGVLAAGVLAWIFGKVTHVTGHNVSDIENLIYVQEETGIQVGELLFAGILIAALGAVMDISMSISSTLQELYDQNPTMTARQLFRSGMTVGRDMMGTMSNTLILAFVGGSINTIVMFYAYDYEYLQLINLFDMAIEIIQGISASMGVILTVPLVSFIGAWMIANRRRDIS